MATKKRRKKKATPPVSKAGRKKELKRFVLEKWSGGDAADDVLKANEVAFVVRTSGGTPLNTTDLGKLWRLLQHELRTLGHKLVRKGKALDPEPKQAKSETPEPDVDPVHDNGTPNDPDDSSATSPASSASQVADLADPDDPHPNQ